MEKKKSPQKEVIKTPSAKKEAVSPIKKSVPAPAKKEETSHAKKEAASPVKKEAAPKIKKETESLVKKSAPAPVKKEAASPVKKEAASPVKKEAASPVKKESASPVKKEAASPIKKEGASPIKKEGASPVKKEGASPAKKEGASPVKKEAAQKAPSNIKKGSDNKAKSPAKDSKGKKNEEEEKKMPESPQKKEAITEISLKEVETKIKEIWERNKTPIIMDRSSQFTTFLKYKGSQSDYVDYSIQEKMGKRKKEDFIEEIRKYIYVSMKNGHTFALFFDKSVIDIKAFFQDVGYFVLPDILIPNKLQDKEFYKKKILLPEEDTDAQGNRGYFEIKEDFSICLLFNCDNLDEIKKKINLPLELFEFIIIKEN